MAKICSAPSVHAQVLEPGDTLRAGTMRGSFVRKGAGGGKAAPGTALCCGVSLTSQQDHDPQCLWHLGAMQIPEHDQACMGKPSSPWVWLTWIA
jgi:hypothetical protein